MAGYSWCVRFQDHPHLNRHILRAFTGTVGRIWGALSLLGSCGGADRGGRVDVEVIGTSKDCPLSLPNGIAWSYQILAKGCQGAGSVGRLSI
jgi:hypothetical protein